MTKRDDSDEEGYELSIQVLQETYDSYNELEPTPNNFNRSPKIRYTT